MNQGIQIAIGMVMPAARATGLLRSSITFQVPDGEYSGTGFPSGNFVDVDGLVGIACQVSSSRFVRVAGMTRKSVPTQEATDSGYVMLDNYYPQAETVWRNGGRVVIGDQIFENKDILDVGSDSQQTHTSLLIQLVTE